MSTTLSTEGAADKARDTNRTIVIPFEALGLDTAIPEAVRALAETTVTETREAYERSKTVLETGLETLERSFDAIGHTSVTLNRKVIEIAHRNVGSGFDLAKSLAGAKNLAENLELQAAYWRKQFGVLMAQAEELRALSTKMTTDAAEPIEQYTTHQAEELRALSAKMATNAAEAIKQRPTHSADKLSKAS